MTGPEQLSAYCWLSRDVSAIAAGMEINLSGWQLLAQSGHSRHCDVLSANDPYRPSTLRYIVASARDDRDARKKAINQGEHHEIELQGSYRARRWRCHRWSGHPGTSCSG